MSSDFTIKHFETSGISALKYGLYLPYDKEYLGDGKCSNCDIYLEFDGIKFYDKEFSLLRRLIKNGDDHSKVVRFVDLYFDITAARYWWQEFDTYRVGVEKISSSTMHWLVKEFRRRFNKGDFEVKWLYKHFTNSTNEVVIEEFFESVFTSVVELGVDMRSKEFYHIVKANLPEGYKQRRIVKISLQTLWRIYNQRKDHILNEWKEFCDYISRIDIFDALYL